MKNNIMFYQEYLNLENELLELTDFIYINDDQLDVNSFYIADFIVRVYIEIEAISKELYYQIFPNRKGKKHSFDTECLKKLNNSFNFDNKIIYIYNEKIDIYISNKKLFPLKNIYFNTIGISYENIPEKSVRTKKAYELIKHNFYKDFTYGTIENLICSLGSLYLLNIYLKFLNDGIKNIKNTDIYKVDFTFGSKLFAVHFPGNNNLESVMNGIIMNQNLVSSSSPFILKFSDEFYLKILNKHLLNPEIELENYLKKYPNYPRLKRIYKDYKKKNGTNFNWFKIFEKFETFLFKINIYKNKDFKSRKAELIKSNEFKNYNSNYNINKSSIKNDKDINKMIKIIGKFLGHQIVFNFKFDNKRIEMNNFLCEFIIDNNEVKYNDLF